MKSIRALGALAVGSLLIAACGGGSTDSTVESTVASAGDTVPSEPADEPVAAPADAPSTDPAADGATTAAVPAALQFSAPLVGGGELDATTLAGKPTVFWFWAPT